MDLSARASGNALAVVQEIEQEAPEPERDFTADPEVQDYHGSLIQAIEEGIVERPPLRPFRELGGERYEGPQSWLQWRRDEGMRPDRAGEGTGWRAKEARLWREAMQHCYGVDWREQLDRMRGAAAADDDASS
eukprot:11163565-Lingulodinium_polyedra.AAC.1